MRIIGTGAREGIAETLICQLTVDEAAQLCGFASAWHMRDKSRDLRVGDKIDVNLMSDTMLAIRQHEHQIGGIRQKLERIARELGPIEPLVRLANTPDSATETTEE